MNALTLGASEIRQLDGLYSLNDLHKAAGGEKRHEPHEFLRIDQTRELINELSNSGDSRNYVQTKRGASGGTYVCRELVYAYAMWISAKFHLTVIRAFDALTSAPSQPAPTLPEVFSSKRWLVHMTAEGHLVWNELQPDMVILSMSDMTQAVGKAWWGCVDTLADLNKLCTRTGQKFDIPRKPA